MLTLYTVGMKWKTYAKAVSIQWAMGFMRCRRRKGNWGARLGDYEMHSMSNPSWVWYFQSHSVVSDCLRPRGLYSPWNSPGQNTGVGSLSLFQGIFLTQGSNPSLPHCRRILYQLNHKGSPRKTGVESLSLLQWIFLTQESNWDPLHCRQMLYQLNYQGSPIP